MIVFQTRQKSFQIEGKNFWIAVFLYRLMLTILVAKHHSLFADEYNQLTEVVYHFVYGGTLLSFEWRVPLRSITHPLIYSLLTFMANYLNIDYPIVVQYNVYIIHILISMIGDYYFIQFGQVFFGRKYIQTALILRFSNFLYMEYSIRPFSNTIEEILFLVGMISFNKIYNEKQNDNNHLFFAFIVPISFIFRNTSSILWFSPLVWILFKKFYLVKYFFLSTLTTFLAQMLIDYTFYKRWTIPFLNFIIFNASKSQFWTEGQFFYFTTCLPAFLLFVLPFSLRGCYLHSNEVLKQNNIPWLLMICTIYLIVLSIVGHKEIRFIYPIISNMLYYAAFSMKKMIKNRSRYLKIFLLANAIFNLFCLILISNYIKVYSPIVKAVKSIPEIKELQIFSWYDFPINSEFHNSNIKINHILCTNMHKIFEDNYIGILNKYEGSGKSLKDYQIYDNWIQQAKQQGPEKLPEWILAPQEFDDDCRLNKIVFEIFYDPYQEVFYELDLMELRKFNWGKINNNYIIYRRKAFI